MQESDETSCWFFTAGEDASMPPIPLDSVDEAFDDVALSVADPIVPWLLAIAAGRDNRLDLFGCEQFSPRVRVVASIGNESVKMEMDEQRFNLGDVIAFTTIQNELQGKAKGIDEEMDLAAEPTSATI